jgi:hypothetical protein
MAYLFLPGTCRLANGKRISLQCSSALFWNYSLYNSNDLFLYTLLILNAYSPHSIHLPFFGFLLPAGTENSFMGFCCPDYIGVIAGTLE